MREEATAFVPGHITGFFSAHPADDPTIAGSRGAGLTLTDGVTVTVEPVAEEASESIVILDGEMIEIEPVDIVLEALDVVARVEAESDLPLGAGFGISGAMALGTALAANAVFGCRLSRNELVTIAHGAEVQAGTGLGDVVAQACGGVPIRLEPGGPQENKLDAIPARARVEYVSFGELSTADVLAGDTDQLTAAGKEALSRVVEEPTLLSFMYASRLFTREAGLLTDQVAKTIGDVTDVNGQASMAMLGETVFALGTGLSDAGYDPSVCATHPAGALLR
ncbi:pantoate kinase [Natrialba magadii ATCC 43099]|uniref:Pantoate kinase n=1 Tax=Natrialba magadii (strain ATCC 43099 / DSM 3394 / CCM 3739 / CIP 104546 / IAM 13178 / JCM 8861 / NBRC 102185 / NCIMB 2190 / MS3) TaxID=547559 RepID=D3SRF2_NATMM|nr:pantoate kinase [Natrialba magadii]ADD04657.1 pantoate kinase [Natrialba magadii ATCC 43099]ELY25314.1 GHMP kinase [Natrialba magadii ATCC 43099]